MNAISTLEVSALQISEVDVLGSLLAQISELTKEADAIKDGIKNAATLPNGDKTYEGAMFKATVIEANRSTVDYKKLCADRGITADELAAYTKVCAVFSVKVTSR